MRLAAHQPIFLPWLGFFDKVRRADVFVLVDHVQFERQDFQNRNRILTRQGVQWLVCPVRRASSREPIEAKEIEQRRDNGLAWGEKAALTLRHAYARAPYFERYMPFLEEALVTPWTHLADMNEHLIRFFLQVLGITTPVVRSTSLEGLSGARTEMILSLCRATGARTYLSGSGGSREYLDVGLLERAGVRVEWQAFAQRAYPQLHGLGAFVPSLSVVDLLFNCGPASGLVLRGVSARTGQGASTA